MIGTSMEPCVFLSCAMVSWSNQFSTMRQQTNWESLWCTASDHAQSPDIRFDHTRSLLWLNCWYGRRLKVSLKSAVESWWWSRTLESRVHSSYVSTIQLGGLVGMGPKYLNWIVWKGASPSWIKLMVLYISSADDQGNGVVLPLFKFAASHRSNPLLMFRSEDWSSIKW